MFHLADDDIEYIVRQLGSPVGLSDRQRVVLAKSKNRDYYALNPADISTLVFCVRRMHHPLGRVAVVHALRDIANLNKDAFLTNQKPGHYGELIEIVTNHGECAIDTVNLIRELAYHPGCLLLMIEADIHKFLAKLLRHPIPHEVTNVVLWALGKIFKKSSGFQDLYRNMVESTDLFARFVEISGELAAQHESSDLEPTTTLNNWALLFTMVIDNDQSIEILRSSVDFWYALQLIFPIVFNLQSRTILERLRTWIETQDARIGAWFMQAEIIQHILVRYPLRPTNLPSPEEVTVLQIISGVLRCLQPPKHIEQNLSARINFIHMLADNGIYQILNMDHPAELMWLYQNISTQLQRLTSP